MGHASGQLLPAENVLSEEDGRPGRGAENPGFAHETVCFFIKQLGNLLLGKSMTSEIYTI